MKRLIIPLFTLILISFFFFSCYYDNEEALYPSITTTCDTTDVTYSGTIAPILIDNCYSCHSDANAAFGGNIHLQSIADVVTNSARVVAAIKQTGPVPMPPNGKLRDCSITGFDIWISNGMLNN